MAIVDDNYSIGPPTAIFAAQPQFAADLAEVGLQLQGDKSKCYIASEYRNEEWDEMRGEIQKFCIRVSKKLTSEGKVKVDNIGQS